MSVQPLVTVIIPSYNQCAYLSEALESVAEQSVATEIYVMDGGSTDGSVDVIHGWEDRLTGWRSHRDDGQAAAVNEGVALGSAPYVCWLNSDDMLLPGALQKMVDVLAADDDCAMVYGRVWNQQESDNKRTPVWVESFSESRLAKRCIISQPGTMVRRSAWESVGGLDESLYMAMDYDLWWKLYKNFGEPCYIDDFVAVNREHELTKTRLNRVRHYQEAISTIRKYHGSVPLKWWLYQPYAVWYKSFFG